MSLFKLIYPSPIGDLFLVADEAGLVGIWFLGQTYFERGLSGQPKVGLSPILEQACDWLDRYFAGQEPGLNNLPLSAQGTDFQKRVWAELAKLPYGQTTTYKALADKLNCKSAQAVGGAVGKNPLSILVPCHRVLGADGSLTGYAGGLDKKIWLLEHEGVSLKLGIQLCYSPKKSNRKEKTMTYIYYEYPKCSTCKAAKKELTQLGLDFTAIDIKATPPAAADLKAWMEATGLELKKYFNTSGNSYRALGLKDKFDSLTVDEALALLAADGMLIKRPLLIKDGKILQIGYKTPYEDLGLD